MRDHPPHEEDEFDAWGDDDADTWEWRLLRAGAYALALATGALIGVGVAFLLHWWSSQ